jgi:hypothetical protein
MYISVGNLQEIILSPKLRSQIRRNQAFIALPPLWPIHAITHPAAIASFTNCFDAPSFLQDAKRIVERPGRYSGGDHNVALENVSRSALGIVLKKFKYAPRRRRHPLYWFWFYRHLLSPKSKNGFEAVYRKIINHQLLCGQGRETVATAPHTERLVFLI